MCCAVERAFRGVEATGHTNFNIKGGCGLNPKIVFCAFSMTYSCRVSLTDGGGRGAACHRPQSAGRRIIL
jgi:hypothetical protein